MLFVPFATPNEGSVMIVLSESSLSSGATRQVRGMECFPTLTCLMSAIGLVIRSMSCHKDEAWLEGIQCQRNLKQSGPIRGHRIYPTGTGYNVAPS